MPTCGHPQLTPSLSLKNSQLLVLNSMVRLEEEKEGEQKKRTHPQKYTRQPFGLWEKHP